MSSNVKAFFDFVHFNLSLFQSICADFLFPRYIQALANNVSFVRHKEIYAAAAEIIGLMLKNVTHLTDV